MKYLIILAMCLVSLALVSAEFPVQHPTKENTVSPITPKIQPEFTRGEAEEMSKDEEDAPNDHTDQITDTPQSNLGVEGEQEEPEELEDVPKWLKPKYIFIFVAVLLVIALIAYFIGEHKRKKEQDNDAVNELLQ